MRAIRHREPDIVQMTVVEDQALVFWGEEYSENGEYRYKFTILGYQECQKIKKSYGYDTIIAVVTLHLSIQKGEWIYGEGSAGLADMDKMSEREIDHPSFETGTGGRFGDSLAEKVIQSGM